MSKPIKLLFTSVGRRVELMQAFHNAAVHLNSSLILYGVDFSGDAPALQYCDKRERICRIADAEYIPQLLELCKREKIDAVIPTIDTDLCLLAENKKRFESVGTKVFVADYEKVAICRDKYLTAEYFSSLELPAPKAADAVGEYTEGFPAFIKPKDGSSSVDAYQAANAEELAVYAAKIKNYIIQPFISGTEYTVDIFCDYEGNPIYITPRIRLAVRSGEVLKTKICQDERIIRDMKRLAEDYRPSGAITVQLIHDEARNINYYIEINPRFGGGAPLSMKAGADSAEALLRILNGEKLSYCAKAAEDGAIYSRFDQSVRVDG